jgi:hypothetical protein
MSEKEKQENIPENNQPQLSSYELYRLLSKEDKEDFKLGV